MGEFKSIGGRWVKKRKLVVPSPPPEEPKVEVKEEKKPVTKSKPKRGRPKGR